MAEISLCKLGVDKTDKLIDNLRELFLAVEEENWETITNDKREEIISAAEEMAAGDCWCPYGRRAVSPRKIGAELDKCLSKKDKDCSREFITSLVFFTT